MLTRPLLDITQLPLGQKRVQSLPLLRLLMNCSPWLTHLSGTRRQLHFTKFSVYMVSLCTPIAPQPRHNLAKLRDVTSASNSGDKAALFKAKVELTAAIAQHRARHAPLLQAWWLICPRPWASLQRTVLVKNTRMMCCISSRYLSSPSTPRLTIKRSNTIQTTHIQKLRLI